MRYYDDDDNESTKEYNESRAEDRIDNETDIKKNDTESNNDNSGNLWNNKDSNYNDRNNEYYNSDSGQYHINGKDYRTGQNIPARPVNRMATFSLMCGFGGTLLLCGCLSFPLSIILGVAAICLSILSKKGQPFTKSAIAGLVLGIISLVFGIAEGLYIIAINYMLQDPNIAPIFDQLLEQYSTGFTQ